MVKPGKGPQNAFCHNITLGLKMFEACGRKGKLVRGWKLLVTDWPKAQDSQCWRAIPHAVVHDVERDIYYCFTSECGGSEYLFLPSSRVVAQLSDEVLLRGGHVMRSVVGGHPRFCQLAVEEFPEAMALTPELATSFTAPRVHVPAGVMMWLERELPGHDTVEVALELGFPLVDDNKKRPHHELTERCVATLSDITDRGGSHDDIMEAVGKLLRPALEKTKRGRALWELRAA